MAPATYKVRKQVHSKVIRPDGSQSDSWTVHLEHQDGTQSTITVPGEAYTAANVHAMAQQQANTVAAVAALPASVPAAAAH